jgi:hypothetical protein
MRLTWSQGCTVSRDCWKFNEARSVPRSIPFLIPLLLDRVLVRSRPLELRHPLPLQFLDWLACRLAGWLVRCLVATITGFVVCDTDGGDPLGQCW